MSFKDEKIYSGMKALVKKSLAILDRNGFEFKYIEDSNIEVDLKNIPPISFLLNDKISRQIYSNSKIEEIEKTKEFAYTCDLVNKIPTFQSDFKWDDLSHFLIAYCNLKKDLEFDEDIFNGLYKRFEDKLYGKNYIMALCPLKKFYLETAEFVLDDEIKIRRIAHEELSFINKEMAGNTLNKLDEIQFTIEYTYDENEFRKPRDADEWTWSAWQNATAICEKKFIEIVALLRLFKEKDGDFHNPLEIVQVPFWGTVPKGIHFNLCDRRIPEDRNYILKREESEGFMEFYRKSLRVTDDIRMFIALERFNLAYEKKRFEDNIIDYVIAFEALFGTKEKSRIGMRIELKSGFLVGDSKEKITEIYKFMHDLYDLRSSIVHGDVIKIPMKIGKEAYYSDYQLRSDIIEIFRKIIRCFFDEGRTEDRKETFAIIEDELKSGENKDKSGEEMVESIYDKIQTKKKAPGVQPEHTSVGVLK
uniref:Uncharacterized protein n=1 Tax=Candidatus Methanophaga sp. ANME-1 ERB7 TaxID=2759913 RepID=A0A7G9Z617_9EURY|nr:hypothetical protein EEOEGNLI_00038 [Methanosarcinales archaeon ANME-1 ERB7]